jgi:GT2 family glycosyltransferase
LAAIGSVGKPPCERPITGVCVTTSDRGAAMRGPSIPPLSFAGMRVSLIIATKGRPGRLAGALESSARALPPDGEVIIVDGDRERSAERVVAELRSRHPELTALYLSSEPGTSLQRNVGIDAATGEVLVFVDDDCIFEPGLFEALTAAYRDPTVVGATGRVEEPLSDRLGSNAHSRLRWLLVGGGRQGHMSSFGFRRPIVDLDRARDVEYMPGALMSARREVAAEVRFDEQLTNYSLGEDDDFSYRVSHRGRIRYEPSAVVRHYQLGVRHMDRRKLDRIRVINRTYLFRKNFPQTLRARAGFAALLVVLCLHRMLNREWSGLCGLLEGIRQVRRSGGGHLESSALEQTGDEIFSGPHGEPPR